MTRLAAQPNWYQEKRRDVALAFAQMQGESPEVHVSPSGRYRLETATYTAGQQTGAFSLGCVYSTADGGMIAEVLRNFIRFPFSWCEGHPSGHDYLICGEDYQGQTVIELDTGNRVDFVPDAAERGFGFCWAAHFPSPDGKRLFVDGCYWAAPYELVLYDFTSPLELPYRELRRWPVCKVEGFQPDGSFRFEYAEEVRRSDGRPVRELLAAESDALDAAPCLDDVVRERTVQVRWRPDAEDEVTYLD